MDVFRSSSNYSIPAYFKDQANDMKNIEAEAKQALSNIKSLYDEIMHPNNADEYELESITESSSPVATPVKLNRQSKLDVYKLRSKSKALDFDSQSLITHCSLCHRQSHQNLDYNTNNSRSDSPVEQQLNNATHNYELKNNIVNHTNSPKTFKITVPQPFTLSGFDKKRQEAKQLKLAKLKDELNQQMEKELNVKVVSKPVPKHTHLKLYNEMVEKNKTRKVERKDKCLEVVGNANKHNTELKPASFPCDVSKTCFKATPIPKSVLGDKVSEKLKNKEEIRKMLMAHRAEEMLKQSSSPISKKMISKSFSMLNLNDYKKETNVNKGSKPNIAEITNRLYTKKCKETILSWDTKVTRYCQQENDVELKNLSSKARLQPEQQLPFLYYPVRMSTASYLREKQIRSEILSRERREQEKQNNKEITETQEEISKKLQKLVPVLDPQKEIEEKVKNFKESQHIREIEYEQELEEIMRRVSQQYLLLERQSKKKGVEFKEDLSTRDKSQSAHTQELSSNTELKSAELEKNESSSESEQFEEMESYSEPE